MKLLHHFYSTIGVSPFASLFVSPLVALVSVLSCLADDNAWSQERFEECIGNCDHEDNFPDGLPPYVPLRERNALPEFEWVFSQSGWTTNQLIEALALAVTNNLSDEVRNDDERSMIPNNALWKLSEINHPAVTNFFCRLNEIGEPRLDFTPILGMFYYTNLEPEVLSYMRSLCVKTNIYERATVSVIHDMIRTLESMPSELKPAATNRVAQYIYFSVLHTTQDITYQDRRLAKFIPSYSNSLQRLAAMRYVESTATNERQRIRARMEIDRLSSLPVGQLNDLPWITGE